MINYDVDYYYNLLRIHTQTAKDIVDKRYKFIEKNILNKERIPDPTILDFGCGVGFMKVFAPDWVHQIDTFDILPVPTTGITRESYDIIMLYDILEHLKDFTEIQSIVKKCKYVVVTVPMKPDNVTWKDYRHFKPGEHCIYYTHDLLEYTFEWMGFELIANGKPECPPRLHVESFVFKKK